MRILQQELHVLKQVTVDLLEKMKAPMRSEWLKARYCLKVDNAAIAEHEDTFKDILNDYKLDFQLEKEEAEYNVVKVLRDNLQFAYELKL